MVAGGDCNPLAFNRSPLRNLIRVNPATIIAGPARRLWRPSCAGLI